MGKINTNLVAIVVLGFALNACVSGQASGSNQVGVTEPQKIVFEISWIGSWRVGVVQNNAVRIFESHYGNVNGWVELPQYEFTLPDGYEVIFGGQGFIWVVVDNMVKSFILENGTWVEIAEFRLSLPHGYERIFGSGGLLGIVVNNRLVRYGLIHETYGWEKLSEREFPFANNKAVFYNGSGISTIVNNTVMAYIWDHESRAYYHVPEVDFNLPNGYEAVFAFFGHLCVVVGNKVTFHLRDHNNRWVEVPELQLNF